MYRFFSPSCNISANKITLSDKDRIHHIKDVLRFKINDKVIIFDEKGNEYVCFIKEFINDKVILEIKDRQLFSRKEKIMITVACAIPKASRMDEIIDKLTQLGVERIIPMETERMIVKLDKHKKILRQDRWKKIALNASLQSQRNTLPIIEPIKDIKQLLSDLEGFDLKLILTLSGERKLLKEVLEESKPKNILVLIGPEGDFAEEELDLAKSRGCILVSLGDLVLRVETAAVAAVSFIRLYESR